MSVTPFVSSKVWQPSTGMLDLDPLATVDRSALRAVHPPGVRGRDGTSSTAAVSAWQATRARRDVRDAVDQVRMVGR